MCIAILNNSGKLSKATLDNCKRFNKDGFGLMYWEDGKANIFKTLDYKAFTTFYFELRKRYTQPVALHFRLATHGAITPDNSHPFAISERSALVHNGIISSLSDDVNVSDSKQLATFLSKYTHWDKEAIILTVLNSMLGQSNKVIVLKDGLYTIFNEDLGIWEGNNWYSNTNYKSYGGSYGGSNSTAGAFAGSWSNKDRRFYYNNYPCSLCNKKGARAKVHYASQFRTYICLKCATKAQDKQDRQNTLAW